jgi:glycosyltransferase involved in cell wall biosynthesis
MKPKMLFWGDSISAQSGYGLVSYHFVQELKNHFDITFVFSGYAGKDINDHLSEQGRKEFGEIRFYPSGQDLGTSVIRKLITQKQFDFVFLNNEIPRVDRLLIEDNFFQFKPMPHILAYSVIDWIFEDSFFGRVNSSSVEAEKRQITLDTVKTFLAPAEHSFRYYQQTAPHKLYNDIIYHGVDQNIFKPFSTKAERDYFRESYFGGIVEPDDILFINCNRNSERKDILRSMLMFYATYKDFPIVKFYSHTNPVEQGVDIREEMENAGVPRKDIERLFIFPQSNDVFGGATPDRIMGKIFASADINISTSKGEGVGLGNYQAMATRTLNMIPAHTSMAEVVRDGKGIVLPTDLRKEYHYWSGVNPHITAPVLFGEGIEKMKEVLQNLYRNRDFYKDTLDKAETWIGERTWDDSRLALRKMIKSIL